MCPAAALAADATVTTNADSGAGTLRDTVAAAASGDTVSFGAGLSGQTISLGSGLSLSNTLTLVNNSAPGGVTVTAPDGAKPLIQTGGTLSLSGTAPLTFRGTDSGWALSVISSSGTLNLGSIGSQVRLQGVNTTVANTDPATTYGILGVSGLNLTGGFLGTVSATASVSGYAWNEHMAALNNLGLAIEDQGFATNNLANAETERARAQAEADAARAALRPDSTDADRANVAALQNTAMGRALDCDWRLDVLNLINGTVAYRREVVDAALRAMNAAKAVAYGICSEAGLRLSGGLSGTVSASSVNGNSGIQASAYGLYAEGAMNGGDANTPLIISGSVSATARDLAAALYSGGAMNLLLTGSLSGGGNGYAIKAGAGSTVTFNPGAGWGLVGKVDLGGAGSSLTLLGTGTAANQFLNIPSLIVGNGATATNWTLNPDSGHASTFGSLDIKANAALNLNENVSISGNIANSGALTYTFGANKTYAGVISGTGSLTKAGASTLTLSGANTYTGATLVNAGTLQAGAANTFSAGSGFTLANTAGAALDLNNYSQTIAGLSGGGAAGGNVALGSAMLTVNNAGNNSYAGVISGTGALAKAGAGTLTLSGANTYTGATLVNAGTLQAGAANTFSAGSGFTLANTAGAVLDLNNFNQTIAGLTGGGAAGGNVALGSAMLTVNNAGNNSYAGVISGTGSLTKAGASTLTLSGANTYTGATLVNAGTLQAGAANIFGASSGFTLANTAGAALDLNHFNQTIVGLTGGGAAGGNVALGSAMLTVNNAGNNSYAGVISGTGALTKAGAGTLTLSGANTYTGATLVNAGTLNLTGSLASTSMTVASGAAMANAGTLQNTGTLTNSGTLTNNRLLTNTGTLNNSGTLANTDTLNNAGTLTNSGTWNNAGGTFANSGTLNNTAAMSGGTLNNSGTLNNDTGGSLNLTALNVLSGSTVNLAPGTAITTTNAALSSTATYRALGSTTGTSTITSANLFTGDAAGGFTQTYSTLMFSSVFTVPAGGTTATLTNSAKDLGSVGGSSGKALDAARLGATPGSPLANLFNVLYGSSSQEQIQGATQQLVGEGVANGFGGVAGQLGAFQGAIGQQQMGLGGGAGGQGLAASAQGGLWSTAGNRRTQGSALGNGLAERSNGVTETVAEILVMNAHGTEGASLFGTNGALSGRGQAQTIHQGSRGGLSGYNAELGLAALGYDARVNDYAHLGVALGYSAGQVRGAGVTTDLSTWMASLYGTADFGALNLDANLAYAYTTGKMKGSYTFPVADNTSGEYASNTYFGALKVSRTIRFEDASLSLTPSVAIEASMSVRDAFTESGSALSKRFAGSTMNTVAVPVGVAVSKDFALDKGIVSPELSAYYVRQLADTQSAGTMTLLNSATPSQVTGADPGKELWRANLGWRYDSSENLKFSLFYNGEFGNKYSSNGATMEVKYAF